MHQLVQQSGGRFFSIGGTPVSQHLRCDKVLLLVFFSSSPTLPFLGRGPFDLLTIWMPVGNRNLSC